MKELPPKAQRYVTALYTEAECVRELIAFLSMPNPCDLKVREAEERYKSAIEERQQALEGISDVFT